MHAAIPSIEQTAALKGRLLDLWERTGAGVLQRLANQEAPHAGDDYATPQDRTDWLSTCLMEVYRDTGDAAVFALLYELNEPAFALAIQGQLRRTSLHVDPADVLQDVFLNIYRYPHRFLSDRADAFRNWGHRIVRNTLLKFLRGATRSARQHSLDDDLQCADPRARSPERAAADVEGAELVNRAYVLYLDLYLLHFGRLSAKEQRALTMVEVDGQSYRDAAADLGIRLENLKMVIFRGRRKIFRGMSQSLQQLAALDRPAEPGRAAVARGTSPVRNRIATGRAHRFDPSADPVRNLGSSAG